MAAPIGVSLGEQVTLLDHKQLGLQYFPDGAVAFLDRKPSLRLLLSAGVSSYLVEGSDIQSLNSARLVLTPGNPEEFDNGYAGISGVYAHRDGKLYAFYHAEDQESMKSFWNEVPGYYGCVGMAVSDDGGRSFTKLGPAITSAQVKDPKEMPDQGCGELCVFPEIRGKYLYAYYVDHSRVEGRGVQIFLARSRVTKAPPLPGTWKKYHEGKFREDGLGGRDTPVLSAREINADATFPHVTYSTALGKYVMVFNIVAYLEHPHGEKEGKPVKSGIYVAFSDDGISWSKPHQLITVFSIPFKDRELAWHPTLLWDSEESVEGWLVYSYTPSWGHEHLGGMPHYMVGRRIRFIEDNKE